MITTQERETDRFGNAIDPGAGYARGPVLGGPADEVRRMLHGRGLVRARGLALGLESLYNLTGVTRAFPVAPEDLPRFRTQLGFYCHFDGRAEELGVRYAGGDPALHEACFATRVSAGMLATMLALVRAGDDVLSVVPAGYSHPSIRNAAAIAGATFAEARGAEAALAALVASPPAVLAVTSITPQKFHFEEAELRRLVAAGAAAGALVAVDDAHGAVRVAYYRQAPVLALGEVDIALLSLDKHLEGPRAALLVGRRAIVERIRARMFQLGLEAPFASYVAGIRALEGYDPAPVRRAGELAAELLERLGPITGSDALYSTGPGVAVPEDDLTAVVLARAGKARTPLVPMEVSSLVAMRLVETSGFVTILAIGMPGSSAPLRILLYPDGERAGAAAIADAVDEALSFTATRIDDVELARNYLLAPPADG